MAKGGGNGDDQREMRAARSPTHVPHVQGRQVHQSEEHEID